MDRLVNDLLTLARLDEGVPMEMAPVELVSLVSDAVRTAAAVGRSGPYIFGDAPGRGHGRQRPPASGPRQPVGQHPGAHPEGTTATVRVDQIGDLAQIEVRDTGPGMPDSEAQRVFERFYRADPARARTRGGSGLGLSIVAAIVTAHGGTVSAASTPGEGLVVTVLIPISAVQQPLDPAAALTSFPDLPPGQVVHVAPLKFTSDSQPSFTVSGDGTAPCVT